MRATETFLTVHNGQTGTANSAAISVTGGTLGAVQVDDAASGTFTVVVQGRVADAAEWRTLNVRKQDGTYAASITAEGIYSLVLGGINDVRINITANSSATLSAFLGVNS